MRLVLLLLIGKNVCNLIYRGEQEIGCIALFGGEMFLQVNDYGICQ